MWFQTVKTIFRCCNVTESIPEAAEESTHEADDEEYENITDLPLPKAPVKPLPPIPAKRTLPQQNSAAFNSQAGPADHIGIS